MNGFGWSEKKFPHFFIEPIIFILNILEIVYCLLNDAVSQKDSKILKVMNFCYLIYIHITEYVNLPGCLFQ